MEASGVQKEVVSDNQSILLSPGTYNFTTTFLGYGEYTGDKLFQELEVYDYAIPADEFNASDFTVLTKDEAKAKAITSLWDSQNNFKRL